MQSWPQFQQPLCQLLAPDAGHDHIGEEKIDGGLRVFDQPDGFFTTLGLDHFVAIGFEKLASQFAQSGFVFDDENCFGAF